MNWRATWILLTMAAALFAFVALVERPLREERARQASRTVLPGLNAAAVTNIEIRPWGQNVIIAQRAGTSPRNWRLTQPIAYPAAAEPVESLLTALAQLQWENRITATELRDQPDAEEKFGLARPQFSVLVQGPGGSRHLAIGATTALGDQVFAQVVGSYDIDVLGVGVLQLLPQSKEQWRDPALLSLAGLPFETLRVRSAGRGFEVERDANHLWAMKLPAPGRADTAKINGLLDELNNLKVVGFVTDDPQADLEPFGLQQPAQTPRLEIALLRDTNVLFDLRVGASPGNFPAVAYAQRQDPANVVLIPTAPLLPWESSYTNFLDRRLISLSPAQIGAIEVRGEDQFVVRRQADGQWQVAGATVFPADPILMNDWLAGFTNIQADIEKTVVADLTAYGLAKPALEYKLERGGSGGGDSNQPVAQIEFGTEQGGRVFERRADESSVNTIDGGEYDRLPRASWQLRDRRVWDFESSNVLAVSIHYLGGDRKYLRDPAGQWTFAPGYHGPPFINAAELEEALVRLGRLRAIYWDGLGDDPSDRFGFKEADHVVTLDVKTNGRTETLAIRFGKRSPYLHPYAEVEKDGQQSVFEFPVDIFDNFVAPDLTLPAALRQRH